MWTAAGTLIVTWNNVELNHTLSFLRQLFKHKLVHMCHTQYKKP